MKIGKGKSPMKKIKRVKLAIATKKKKKIKNKHALASSIGGKDIRCVCDNLLSFDEEIVSTDSNNPMEIEMGIGISLFNNALFQYNIVCIYNNNFSVC